MVPYRPTQAITSARTAKPGTEPGKEDLLVHGLVDLRGFRLDIRHRHARVRLVHDGRAPCWHIASGSPLVRSANVISSIGWYSLD